MLQQIPTVIILAAPSATLDQFRRQQLQRCPQSEYWAWMTHAAQPPLLAERYRCQPAPAGCPCCSQGLLFQQGLKTLLQQAQPDRLFVELQGFEHAQRLIRQWQQAPWRQVLQGLQLWLLQEQDIHPWQQQWLDTGEVEVISINP